MAQLVYPIQSFWTGEIVQELADCANAVFSLTIGLVVAGGCHFKLDLKVLHKLLPDL
jgi:hypothetical protein